MAFEIVSGRKASWCMHADAPKRLWDASQAAKRVVRFTQVKTFNNAFAHNEEM